MLRERMGRTGLLCWWGCGSAVVVVVVVVGIGCSGGMGCGGTTSKSTAESPTAAKSLRAPESFSDPALVVLAQSCADDDDAPACGQVGERLARGQAAGPGDPKRALAFLEKACELRAGQCSSLVRYSLSMKSEVPSDAARAVAIAELVCIDSRLEKAACEGVRSTLGDNRADWDRLCRAGTPASCLHLGLYARDETALRRACELGEAFGCTRAAGVARIRSAAEAREWLDRACRLGRGWACR